jgi:hypothetical protein
MVFGFGYPSFKVAPKVQYNIAQGNALGFWYRVYECAPKEQYNRWFFILPFQGEKNGVSGY